MARGVTVYRARGLAADRVELPDAIGVDPPALQSVPGVTSPPVVDPVQVLAAKYLDAQVNSRLSIKFRMTYSVASRSTWMLASAFARI